MSIFKLALIFLVMAIAFFIIDIGWLGIVAKDLYNKYIGHMRGNVKWPAAIIFYLIFIIGIMIFAVLPGLEKGSFQYTVMYGAMFGFFTYATYELTNYSTLKDWPLPLVFIDIAWGIILTASVASVGYLVGSKL